MDADRRDLQRAVSGPDGIGSEKPTDSFMQVVPATSEIIANSKNSQF
jgi:hypothetical protein